MKYVNGLKVKKSSVYTADFETTSYPNLIKDGYVRVWLWSIVNCETFNCWFGYDIDSFIQKLKELKPKIVFFHNLKFDGNFLLYRLLELNEQTELTAPNGIWFSLKWNDIEFRDSLKKFQTTVLGLSVMLGMELKHSIRDNQDKNRWDYYIPKDYIPTKEEIEYCIHDSRIVAKGIANEWDLGRCRLTNSSEAFHNAKSQIKNFDKLFPQLSEENDTFVRATYKGGFCSINGKYQNIELNDIYAYDVNGLYGYVMDEGIIPVGEPYDTEPVSNKDVCFIDFYCEFYLKTGYAPILQIKNNPQYIGRETEYLIESDGITHLHLTDIDYELFKKHYHVYNEFGHEFKSFRSEKGILSPIIQHNIKMKAYYSTKENYDDYKRTVYKNNTNMLYGSFGLSTINDLVTPYINEDGVLSMIHTKETKPARYIPVASYITSQARKITITAVQNNFKNWIYSDTDSMYLTKPAKNIPIDDTKSGCWKFEGIDGMPYAKGKFLRQKTYILADENYNIYSHTDKYGKFHSKCVCAGLPDDIKKTIKWDDFKIGSSLGFRKAHTLVKGGVCLMDREFRIL